MSIERIHIQKFKSYSNCIIDKFHAKINIIYGKNGSGKSNLLQALQFIFSEEIKREDRLRLLKIKENSISISRILEERDNIYKLDDKVINLSQFTNVLECFSIQRHNPYNIVPQNTIQSISNMTDKEIYQLLEEVSGVKSYKIKEQKAQDIFQKVQRDKSSIEILLTEIEERVEQLNTEKQNYLQNQEHEKYVESIQYLFYEKIIEEYEERKSQVNKKLKEIAEELEKEKEILNQMKDKQSDKQERLEQLKETQKELYKIESSIKKDLSLYEEKIRSYETNQKSISIQQKEESNLQKKNQKALEKVQQEKNNQEILFKQQEQKVHDLQQQIQEHTLKLEQLLLREKYTQQTEKKAFVKQRTTFLNNQIQQKKQQMSEQQKKQQKISENLINFQNEIIQQEETLQNLKQRQQDLQKDILQKKKTIQSLRENNLQKKKDIDNSKITLYKEISVQKSLKFSLQKAFYSPFLSTYLKIVQQFQAKPGFYGLFIDYLEILPQLTFAYDIASKGKLFAFLVEDQEIAWDILSLNKQIQGAKIHIFPLDWIKDESFQQDEEQEKIPNYTSLLDPKLLKIQCQNRNLSQKIKNLANMTFGSYGITQKYEDAVQIAKTFGKNCITKNRQVAYAEGFLSKIGFFKSLKKDKITLWNEFIKREAQINELETSMSVDDKKIDENQTQISTIQNQINQKQQELNDILSKIGVCMQMINSTKIQQSQEKEKEQHLQEAIIQIQNNIKEIEEEQNFLKTEKKWEPLSEGEKQEMLKIQDFLTKNKPLLAQYLQEKNLLDKNILQKQLEERKIFQEKKEEDSVDITQTLIKEEFSVEEADLYKKLIIQGKNSLDQIYQQINQVSIQISNLEKTEENNEKYQLSLNNCTVLEENFNKNNLKLFQYMQKANEISQKQSSLNFSQEVIDKYKIQSKDFLKSKLKESLEDGAIKKYTTKDKLLFEKIENLEQKYNEYREKYEQLQQNEDKCKKIMNDILIQCEDNIKRTFSKFEQQLKKYFFKLAPEGQIDISMNRKNEIKIYLTFKQGQNASKCKRIELSGGEKSVFSVLIILALQKCDPTSFYFFDEFDADMDPNYISQIANIIKENSNQSQFIIISHKPEFLQSFQENECRCFRVQIRDKISEIIQTSLENATDFIKHVQD